MEKTGFRFSKKQLGFLNRQKAKVAKASAAALKDSGVKMLDLVKKQASFRAYSISELAARGHPYAKRRGSIGNTGTRPKYAVGKRRGKFLSSIRGKVTNQYEYRIFYDNNEHTRRIVAGTKIMIGRDVVAGAAKASFKKWEKSIQTSFMKRWKGGK